ncbi:MAG: ThiS family [Thermoproteota archaeon]|nr:ThiS family [Thermoproteota archaeon]
MRVEIKFFSQQWFHDCSSEILVIEDRVKIRDLKSIVSLKHIDWKDIKRALTSLNGEIVSDDTILKDGDVISFFPPVSGG